MRVFVWVLLMLSLSLLGACSGGASSSNSAASIPNVIPVNPTDPGKIYLNQIGYLPGAQKMAVLSGVTAKTFKILEANTQKEVFSGTIPAAALWQAAQEQLSLLDFSALRQVGEYWLQVDGTELKAKIVISQDAYPTLNDAALKAFYFQRASTALLPAFAGVYQRALGHPDTEVRIHSSAATALRPAGTLIAAPAGWYDAGDYNKYVVNSGISTYSLLAAYERFPQFLKDRQLNIPESADAVPDVLNEVMWNLTWLLAMQDPNDGGVYHKLTSAQFSGFVMPSQDTSARFVVQKTTAASLDFAAVMAMASRLYQPYASNYPGMSEKMRKAAIEAYSWAKANRQIAYQQPSDIQTGQYGDEDFSDEFLWASTELFLATDDAQYYAGIDFSHANVDVPSWGGVRSLAWMSLAFHLDRLKSVADQNQVQQALRGTAQSLTTKKKSSALGVSMDEADFVWGSNSQAMNQAVILLSAFQMDRTQGDWLAAAQALFDYVLGRNPNQMSFVTGFGTRSPRLIHHRPSAADGIDAPIPGFLVGGPTLADRNDCGASAYPSALPAKSYLDAMCSYSTNEVAINWNAALVFVSTGLIVMSPVGVGQ